MKTLIVILYCFASSAVVYAQYDTVPQIPEPEVRYVFEKYNPGGFIKPANEGYQLWQCVAQWSGRDNAEVTAGHVPERVKTFWVNAEYLIQKGSEGENPATSPVVYFSEITFWVDDTTWHWRPGFMFALRSDIHPEDFFNFNK